MAERPPAEDPFADLYGRLPDPRDRERVTGRDAATERPAAPATDPPLSRRAARESSRRAAPIDTPVAASRPPVDSSDAARGARTEQPARRDDVRAPATSSSARAHGAEAVRGGTRTASATLEDLFTGEASTDALGSPPPPPDKRKRRLGGWIVLALVLVLIGGVAAGGVWVWNTYEDRIRSFMGWEEPKDFEAGIAAGEVTVTIADGDNGQVISNTLHEAGVTKTAGAFYDMLIATGQNPMFYPGAYRLQEKMTAAAALAALQDPANKLENAVQLREGLTVKDSIATISESMSMPIEDLQAAVADPAAYGVAAASLEGWLFPATYTFDPGVTATDVIRTMVDRAVASLDQAGVPVDDRQRVLTVASIIQREARFEADFYKVSRVIENRLDASNQETFGLLQMDSTAQYGIGEDDGTVSSSEEALTDDNPWNTYVNTGLPVGPIANPGDVAIDAAMHPADGPWLYFVTVNLDTGETVFTSTLAEHDVAREQWLSWCEQHPDSGC